MATTRTKKKTTRKRKPTKKTNGASAKARGPKPKIARKDGKGDYKRFPWEPKADQFLIARYNAGDDIATIAEKVSKRFKIPRSASTTQGRLGWLRRDGQISKRPAGKAKKNGNGHAAANGKSNGRGRRRANGASEPKVLAVDLGDRGHLKVEVTGPIVLDREFMEDLSSTVGKLLMA
jgi:hypothetical protein